jgi:F-type H+-transporting ATPase subunit b
MESPALVTPNLVTFFVTFVNIGILFFILRAILFKPVTKFMDARAKKIQDTIEQAEKDKSQAKLLLSQYEDQLKHAEEEADKIIHAAREQAGEQADRIVAEAREEAGRYIESARRQAEAEQRSAFAEFRKNAAKLVLAASLKFAGREFRQEDNRRYADMLLEEISRHAGAGKN